MIVAGSSRFSLNRNERKIGSQMAREAPLVIDDIEEGEISDSESLEEIIREDYVHDAGGTRPKADRMGWMGLPGNYAGNLANLAWMQAVKNKPLADIFVRDDAKAEELPKTSGHVKSASKTAEKEKEESACVVNASDQSSDEVEKEEGELEEGELLETEEELGFLDTDAVQKDVKIHEGFDDSNKLTTGDLDKESKDREVEKRVNSVQDILKSVTAKDIEKSFLGVLSQIRTAMETLNELLLESHVPVMDDLTQQTFTGIKTLHSVFLDGSLKHPELYRDSFLRFLFYAKDQNTLVFSSNQIKELEAMIQSADSGYRSLKNKLEEKEKEITNSNATGDLIDLRVPAEISIAQYILPKSQLSSVPGSGDSLHNKPVPVSLSRGNVLTAKPVSYDNSVGNVSFEKMVTTNCNTRKDIKKAFEPLKIESTSKSRADFGPLINPHMDHDENSLPSPTREGPSPLPVQKTGVTDDVLLKSSHLMTEKQEELANNTAMHPYMTDALKAVSSYQQKFGRNSFFTSDRLPSPTPSDECDDIDGDSSGDVSSATAFGNAKAVSVPVSSQSATVPSAVSIDGSNGQSIVPAKDTGLPGPVSISVVKAASKSRDPRLRNVFASSAALFPDLNKHPLVSESNAPKNEVPGGIHGQKKHSATEDTDLDGHAAKRQRNGSTNSSACKDPRLLAGRGGWLENSGILGSQPSTAVQSAQKMDIDVRKLENGDAASNKRPDNDNNLNLANNASPQLSAPSTTQTVVSLPSLLKDFAAVNPTMLMQLLQMEQQRLAAGVPSKSSTAGGAVCPPSTNALAAPTSGGAVVSLKAPEVNPGSQKLHGAGQTSLVSTVRMKPRDPRRILQNNLVQQSQTLASDQLKTDGPSLSHVQGSKDAAIVTEQTEQASSCVPSQSGISVPDIAPQFTMKLKNIAELLSGSPLNKNVTIVPDNIQPLMGTKDTADAGASMISLEQPSGTSTLPGEGTEQPQSPWGDVDHLLDGYDDQQRAAIQKERARRIEEQNKMFAARKLCLVLDLDHTLLNSAKFVEVDPIHEDILRKKEEQDKEKPQRHLFRFPHMGMWTKLRPGIWNFLEKASKLFELHLYTMGNKLYATEMAKVLDPMGTLFAGRVISRGDDGDPFDGDDRVPKSKDLDGVLGMESAVIIIDDSVRVWPHNRHNLILVERYTYFPCSRRQFGLLGPSLLEIDHDERPEEGTLASSLAVIERIHHNFFSHPCLNDLDVRNILAAEQRKILSSCRIVFSRIFPVGEVNPHLHPLWKTAEQFGAVCTNQIDDQVTHVVANSLGTDKVNWALSTGKFVVHPGWVEASALLYRRVNERDFAVKL